MPTLQSVKKDHYHPDPLKKGPLLGNLSLLASLPCKGLAPHLPAPYLSLDLWLVYCLTVGTNSLTVKRISDPGVSPTDMKCVKGAGRPLHQARLPTLLLTAVVVKLGESKGTVALQDSSIASISSSDFSSVDLGQIRHSLATLRADPDSKARLPATVRQFKSELRQSRRQHRDSTRGMRNETKGLKGELKAQRKEMKAELKSFIKDARAAHKADRKVRKAERKAGRAQRRAERRGTDAHAKDLKKVAKAEAKALKAQRRVLEVDAIARARAMQADGLSNGGREDGLLHNHAGEKVFEKERRDGEQEMAERTRAMGLTDTKGQENGVCVKEG
ncbi:MAG: hypothetical protein Q9223_000021 [Gallowayella weberi]